MNLLPQAVPVRASRILYASSAGMNLFGILIPLMDMAFRAQTRGVGQDTFVELLEFNPLSQVGLALLALGAFHFYLGLKADRQGA